ncbi:MAG TPA: TetR/AcrR family transcriptional regulator [Alphaproteobacteria bacterium]|nr:TetR/AcrR family transcriptional regulator [Alphaproteobacteria bacterium]
MKRDKGTSTRGRRAPALRAPSKRVATLHAPSKRAPVKRDPEATQAKILDAATEEFARHGFDGARIERISGRAGTNDRSLYYYFGSKENLFRVAIERVYLHMARAERALNVEGMDPRDGVKALVAFTWNYYLDHPEMITLLNAENLHRAVHIRRSAVARTFSATQVEVIKGVLDAGAAQGLFRPDLDPIETFLTISALGYFYLSNRYTLSNYVGVDLMQPERRARWLEHISAVVLDHMTATGPRRA